MDTAQGWSAWASPSKGVAGRQDLVAANPKFVQVELGRLSGVLFHFRFPFLNTLGLMEDRFALFECTSANGACKGGGLGGLVLGGADLGLGRCFLSLLSPHNEVAGHIAVLLADHLEGGWLGDGEW